jgi:hypothetical protein
MTEAEWDLGRDLAKMVRSVDPCAFDRKLRLFAVACCHRVSAQIRDPDALCLLDLIEKQADQVVDLGSLRSVWVKVPFYPPAEGAVKQAAALDCASWQASTDCYLRAARDAEEATTYAIEGEGKEVAMERFKQRGRERSVQVGILRDIFGNPFRPVTIDPSWLTSNVVSILADALQDAGCDNEDVQNHCWKPGEHTRGCWVVDLLLSKE